MADVGRIREKSGDDPGLFCEYNKLQGHFPGFFYRSQKDLRKISEIFPKEDIFFMKAQKKAWLVNRAFFCQICVTLVLKPHKDDN